MSINLLPVTASSPGYTRLALVHAFSIQLCDDTCMSSRMVLSEKNAGTQWAFIYLPLL